MVGDKNMGQEGIGNKKGYENVPEGSGILGEGNPKPIG